MERVVAVDGGEDLVVITDRWCSLGCVFGVYVQSEVLANGGESQSHSSSERTEAERDVSNMC